MIRAVIDTNVLVSAMISSAGNEAVLLMAIAQGLVIPCFSAEVLVEYSEVLLRPRFGFPVNEVDALTDMFRSRGQCLDPVEVTRISPDPDDDKFIACAVAARVEFLVTGNKRHFPEDQLAGTKVVNAGELLGIIARQL